MNGPRSFTILAIFDAVLLMATTAIAFGFVLKGKVQQHRAWMTRSFAVALVFVEGRLVLGLTNWENTRPELNEAVIWTCIAFSVFAADIVLQWQETRRSRPVAAKVKVARELGTAS
jgi:hypothetical protein